MIEKFKKMVGGLLKSNKEKRHSLVGAGNLWQMKRDFQIKFLLDQGLKKTDTLMDIGCGTLRGGIPIIKFLDNGNYYGVEVRENVLNEGRKELKSSKLEDKNPKLISFDNFGDIIIDREIDVMFAFSVLIHLKDQIAEDCFKMVGKFMSNEGVFYANVNIGSTKDGEWQGFPVVCRSMDFYSELAVKYGMQLETMGNLKELGHNTGKKSDVEQQMLKISKISG